MVECNTEACMLKFTSLEKEVLDMKLEIKELKAKTDDIKLIQKDIEIIKDVMSELKNKLDEITKKPEKRLETIIGAITVAIIGIVTGYLFKK